MVAVCLMSASNFISAASVKIFTDSWNETVTNDTLITNGSFTVSLSCPLNGVDLSELDANSQFSLSLGLAQETLPIVAGPLSSAVYYAPGQTTASFSLTTNDMNGIEVTNGEVTVSWTATNITITGSASEDLLDGADLLDGGGIGTGKNVPFSIEYFEVIVTLDASDNGGGTFNYDNPYVVVRGTAIGKNYKPAGGSNTYALQTGSMAGSIDLPDLAISSPNPNSKAYGSNAVVELKGTARSTIGVSDIQCYVNGDMSNSISIDQAGELPTNTISWTAEVDLSQHGQIGPNIISVVATDIAGDETTALRTFVWVETNSAVVTVSPPGAGTVKGLKNGQVLQVGSSYTVTATPIDRDWIFASWTDASGDVLSSNATFVYTDTSTNTLDTSSNTPSTFETDGTLIANFVPNPFPNSKTGLSLIAQPGGTIAPAPAYNGALLYLGESYTVVAKPLPGYAFSGWSGTILADSNPLNFVMTSNMSLQANFVLTNPFPVLQGVYNGLFYPSNNASASNSGYFHLSLGSGGKFSATVLLSGHTSGFTGVFDQAGNANLGVHFVDQTELQIGLALEVSDRTITGSLSNAFWTAQLQSYRADTSTKRAGTYTILISGSTNASASPPGTGVGTATIDANGTTIISGTLADGATFTEHTTVAPNGELPLCVSLGNGAGILIGWLNCGAETAALWMQPPTSNSVYYNNGFTATPNVVVAQYIPPNAGQPLLPWASGTISFSAGNLPGEVTGPIAVVGGALKTSAPSISNLQIQVTRASGLVSGSFIHPVTRERTQFHGALLQNPDGIYSLSSGGWFLGTDQGGAIQIAAALSAPVAEPASDIAAVGFIANWASVPGADGFRLDVSTNSDFNSFVLQDQGTAGDSFPVTGLSPGLTYYYRVRAVGSGQTTANSSTIDVTALTPVPVTNANIGPEGGTISAPSDSPLAGVVLQVPTGAYSNTLNFVLSSSPISSANLPLVASPLTPLICVDNGGAQANDIMMVTVPVVVAPDEMALGLLYNPTIGQWEVAPTSAVTDGVVTVATSHFSYLDVIAMKISSFFGQTNDSGFLPGVDDWEFTNTGSYLNPGGDCEGMSQSAMWYFLNEKSANGNLFDQFNNSLYSFRTPNIPDDDILGRKLVAEVQSADHRSIGFWNSVQLLFVPPSVMYAEVAAMIHITGEPALIWLTAKDRSKPSHAVIARKVDPTGIYLADPNHPGDPTQELRWDSDTETFITYDGYDQFHYLGKSAVADWSMVPPLWAELEDKDIGEVDFPEFKVALNEQQGSSWVEVGSVSTEFPTEQPIDINSLEAQVWVYVLSGSVQTLSWTVYSPDGEPFDPTIPLDPGTNLLGVEIVASTNASNPNHWTGFAWLTVFADCCYVGTYTGTAAGGSGGGAVTIQVNRDGSATFTGVNLTLDVTLSGTCDLTNGQIEIEGSFIDPGHGGGPFRDTVVIQGQMTCSPDGGVGSGTAVSVVTGHRYSWDVSK